MIHCLVMDTAKRPRPFGQEPSGAEYEEGSDRVVDLIRTHCPKVVVFVYKKVLDNIVHFKFNISERSTYGFNSRLEPYFGCRVFAFPLPGTPCNRQQIRRAMQELAAESGATTSSVDGQNGVVRSNFLTQPALFKAQTVNSQPMARQKRVKTKA